MLERPHIKGPSASSLFWFKASEMWPLEEMVGNRQCSHGSGTLRKELHVFAIYLRLLL